MIRALGHVAKKKGTAPGGKLSVLGKAFRGGQRGEKYYQTLLRCDMRGGEEGTTTLAFPAEHFPRTNAIWGGLYTRTDKETAMMRSIDSFYDIAGGRPWRTAASGARLPVSPFPDVIWLSDKDAGIFTEEEWKEKFPGGSRTLWEDEKTVGARLMDFEERKNDIDLRKVQEKLPNGFIREGQNIRPGHRPSIPQ
ncbi:hypothetical protein CEP51_008832 [Fusarium floridanum]|uniref:Uncharacterized protein n=1 Tax=Fusarium floridanum TaxID=1325733 RepID=A0A428RJI8_9HYPO|nr:hypothetical protein CEP51_008832 [Fusarium floridanum]